MTRLFALSALLSTAACLVAAQTTREPCARVRNLGINGDDIPAQIAYNCLTSVPFFPKVGLSVVENFKKLSQFHSTLGDLKNPGDGYANPAVDIIALLDETTKKINNGGFLNQYQFEEELALIVSKSFDGHYSMHGNTFGGALGWRRGRTDGTLEASLISVSTDGAKLPQVYFFTDLHATSGLVSPIAKINGEDIVTYIGKEMEHQAFHDPDARWNTLFARQQSASPGAFISPWFYPGANFTATFENGTSKTIRNFAYIPSAAEDSWKSVVDGETFYLAFVQPASSGSKKMMKRGVPPNYPKPVIEHSAKGLELGAFFLDGTGLENVAVLSMNTFSTDKREDGLEFQALVEKFITYAKAQNKTKLIVDVSSNGGGSLFLGYDIFKQLFPSIEPDIGTRMRSSDMLNILGSQFGSVTYKDAISGVLNGTEFTAEDIYLSSIHWSGNVNANGEKFTSWDQMDGPVTINNSSYTEILRYNFSNPDLYIGDHVIAMSGYGERAYLNTQPFKTEDIVLLHDGYCASTCAVFSDLMRRQGGVKSYVLGGRPQYGPMQSVGGTKGALLLSWSTLGIYIDTVLTYFGKSSAERTQWAKTLPQAWQISFSNEPSVNFRSGYHPGSDTPMQFLNETAHCRLFYTPEMLANVTGIWDTVARLAWGVSGGSGQTCVQGSVTEGKIIGETKSVQQSPPSGGGQAGQSGSGGKSGSAGVATAVSWGAMGAAVVLGMLFVQL